MEFDLLKRVLAALEARGVTYAIFGAVALNLHGETFTFSDLETERIAFEELTVTAVTPRMLYRMKRNTVRPKDRADAAEIRERFGLEE